MALKLESYCFNLDQVHNVSEDTRFHLSEYIQASSLFTLWLIEIKQQAPFVSQLCGHFWMVLSSMIYKQLM